MPQSRIAQTHAPAHGNTHLRGHPMGILALGITLMFRLELVRKAVAYACVERLHQKHYVVWFTYSGAREEGERIWVEGEHGRGR